MRLRPAIPIVPDMPKTRWACYSGCGPGSPAPRRTRPPKKMAAGQTAETAARAAAVAASCPAPGPVGVVDIVVTGFPPLGPLWGSMYERPRLFDPSIDLRVPRRRLREAPWPVLTAIAAGGMIGTLARFGLSSAFPHAPGTFDWATFAINASGCLLIGVLMVLITETWEVHRLVRPFLGVGVLGGFTTFSTHIVDAQQALGVHQPRVALTYLAATVITAMLAVWAGTRGTRFLVRLLTRRKGPS